MKSDRMKSYFWVIVIFSWAVGFVIERWFGTGVFFSELSKAVRVTSPMELNYWWEVIVYFSLSPVAAFVLSHIFFGIGGAFFMFARGVYDYSLVSSLEGIISSWSVMNIPMSEVWTVLIIFIILGVNLIFCLWSSQLGIQRSFYTLFRLRNKPIDPEFGWEPISNLLIIVGVSIPVGIVSAIIFTYI